MPQSRGVCKRRWWKTVKLLLEGIGSPALIASGPAIAWLSDARKASQVVDLNLIIERPRMFRLRPGICSVVFVIKEILSSETPRFLENLGIQPSLAFQKIIVERKSCLC